jgi:hypothetical protein
MSLTPQEQFDALFDIQDESSDDNDACLLEATVDGHGRLGPAQGHGSGNQVERLALDRHEDRVEAYFKPANGLHKVMLSAYKQSRASATLAEAAAWRLAVELGNPYRRLVAPCVVRILMEIDDGPGALSLKRPGENESDEPTRQLLDDCCDAAFFDALIGQQDRHSGNWLWDASTARLTLIDHGCSFARRTDPCNRSRLSELRRRRGRARLTDAEIVIAERIRDSDDLLGLGRSSTRTALRRCEAGPRPWRLRRTRSSRVVTSASGEKLQKSTQGVKSASDHRGHHGSR